MVLCAAAEYSTVESHNAFGFIMNTHYAPVKLCLSIYYCTKSQIIIIIKFMLHAFMTAAS